MTTNLQIDERIRFRPLNQQRIMLSRVLLIILLGMSSIANAALMRLDATFVPGSPNDDTYAEGRFFYDSDDVAALGTSWVTLTSIELRYRGASTTSQFLSDTWTPWHVFSNAQTGPCGLPQCNTYTNYQPIEARFDNSVFWGTTNGRGIQKSENWVANKYGDSVDQLSTYHNAAGNGFSILIRYDRFNPNDQLLQLDTVTPPVSVVPIPPAAWFFGSGFLGLIGIARKTKS